MTAPPIPTVVPQDAWYRLTTGGISPSQNDSVPNASFLAPSGVNDGVVGALDGALIYLQGTTTQLDGGQQWLMWDDTSVAVANGVTVFNPWYVTATLGRWLTAGTPPVASSIAGGQIITSGASVAITASATALTYVLVNKTVGSATTLFLPTSRIAFQVFRIKDGKGDASSNVITIDGNGVNIDGGTQVFVFQDYGEIDVWWDGTKWRSS